MIFRAVYNKAIFLIEASSSRMAKHKLKKAYGFDAEPELVIKFKHDKRHLAEATRHEQRITHGRTEEIFEG